MKKKIVVIGGGTGTTVVLSALRGRADYDISVIVSMTDDGGSNAVIRDEFGLLPLSDLRKSIIALSDVGNGILRELFMYRFGRGEGLSGHTLGNLIMTALSDITGSELEAIEASKKLFRVKGKVIPVTLQKTQLVAHYETGQKIYGEHLIDEPALPTKLGRIKTLALSNKVAANLEALRAIREADFILAGPGDLYTTTLASLVVPGISSAIKNSKAKFVFINNLMSKHGQTTGMRSSELATEIAKYAGRVPDVVIVHHGQFPKDILKKYAKQREWPIVDDLVSSPWTVFRANLIHNEPVVRQKGDTLKRSLIRHDRVKLGKLLSKIIKNYGRV